MYTPNARGRYVHLPECRWLHWNAARYDRRAMQVMEPGEYYVPAELHETPVFLRENHLTVLCEPGRYVDECAPDTLQVVGLVTGSAEFRYYEDDGQSYEYRQGKQAVTTIRVRKEAGGYQICGERDEQNGFRSPLSTIQCEIYDAEGGLFTHTLEL